MITGHDDRFDGVFGEEGATPRRKRRAAGPGGEPPLAGLFGARARPMRQGDIKSPASKPKPPIIDLDED